MTPDHRTRRRAPAIALAIVAACLAVACKPKLEVTHSPLNPNVGQAVTYTATASDPNGIKEIRIIVNGSVVKTCANATSCSETLVSNAPDGSIVSYAAQADDKQDNTAVKGTYFYGVGAAHPIWVPARLTIKPHTHAIDVCFAMDTDYGGNLALFQMDVFDKIHNRLFETDVVESNTEKYNFYLSRAAVSAGKCGVIPAFMEGAGSQCDAFVVLHNDTFRDCTLGDNFSAEGSETKSFIHEAGHALYGLADEYEGDTSYFQPNVFPNIFGNFIQSSNVGEIICQDQVSALGGDPTECTEFCDDPNDCGAGWWRHTTDTVVMNRGFFSDKWGAPARARVDWFHDFY
ncbi:MAG: hypothetical protein ACQGVK_03940 [Myxococcota bacterium]